MVRQAYGALDMAKALARLMEMATGVCCTSWGSSSTAPAGSGLLFEEVCFFKSRADFFVCSLTASTSYIRVKCPCRQLKQVFLLSRYA